MNIDELFIYWANHLGLDRWHLVFTLCTPEECHTPAADDGTCEPCYGLTMMDATNYAADVYVVDPNLLDHPHGFEVTLVHELLHVLWADLCMNDTGDIAHRCMHRMAMTLVQVRTGRMGNHWVVASTRYGRDDDGFTFTDRLTTGNAGIDAPLSRIVRGKGAGCPDLLHPTQPTGASDLVPAESQLCQDRSERG